MVCLPFSMNGVLTVTVVTTDLTKNRELTRQIEKKQMQH